MSQPAIEVDNLVKVFQRRGQTELRAVDGLSFEVQRGAIFGLLGPNGAGKTTTLRVLTTLVQANLRPRARDGRRCRGAAARSAPADRSRHPGKRGGAVSFRAR